MLRRYATLCVLATLMTVHNPLLAQEKSSEEKAKESKGTTLRLGRAGELTMVTPGDWKKVEPRSRMLQYEFSAPTDAKEGDETARVTVMGAGGSVEANIDRWYGQFTQSDGKSTKEVSKVEEFKAGGQTVHFVNIPGTFKESMGGGPFAPGRVVERKDYRMLGAIVVTEKMGQYFIKMTGPDAIVGKQAEAFKKMLKDLEVK